MHGLNSIKYSFKRSHYRYGTKRALKIHLVKLYMQLLLHELRHVIHNKLSVLQIRTLQCGGYSDLLVVVHLAMEAAEISNSAEKSL